MILAVIAAAAPGGTLAGVGVNDLPPVVPSAVSDFTLTWRQYMTVLMTGVGLCAPMWARVIRTLSRS